MFELVHSLPRVGQPDRLATLVDSVAHLVAEPAVELGRVLLELDREG